MNMNKKLSVIIAALSILAVFSYFWRQQSVKPALTPPLTNIEEAATDVEVVTENLKIPWEVAFLPEGEILITERPGTLLKINKQRQIIEIQGVEHVGEGGLLGLAVHPSFKENNWIYLYLTVRTEKGLSNRIERYQLNGARLLDRTVIIEGISAAAFHDGGRIEFGPDGYLYVTTGDAGNRALSQSVSNLNGKILRLKDDGSIPKNNPFGNAVYSYGHRNSQGLTWDSSGNLWATEHGRSGIKSGYDELNLINKGKNYGWPTIQGPQTQADMITPVIQSGPTNTWAPAGAAFYNGSIFFAGLKGEALYEYQTKKKKLIVHFEGKFGRLRAVVLGPDGYLYVTTSNTDGRGTARESDDKLIKINPSTLPG